MSHGSTLDVPSWTRLSLLDPEPEHLDLCEIAGGLARTYRWRGQFPLTVAQHSVIVSKAVPPEHAVAGLLHDAPEGLGLGDLPTPIKYAPGFSAYRRLEAKYLVAVGERFGFEVPLDPSVKRADKRALRQEVETFLGPESAARFCPRVKALPGTLRPWPPEMALERFLDQAEKLGLA